MDLLRTLTNHEFAGMADRLARRLRSLPHGRSPDHVKIRQRRARYGSVERAVLDGIALMIGSWTLGQLHAEIEGQLDAPISYGSVKATIAKLASGPTPVIERLGRGRYIRID